MISQLDLFGGEVAIKTPKPPKAPKPVISEEDLPPPGKPHWQFSTDELFLRMSSIQKLIRRGLEDPALENANWLYRMQWGVLRKRLRVILLEDIGLADMPFVMATMTALSGAKPGWPVIRDLVLDLCRRPKSRDSDDGLLILWQYKAIPAECIPDQAEWHAAWSHINDIYWHGETFWDWAGREAERLGPETLAEIHFLASHYADFKYHSGGLAMWRILRAQAGTQPQERTTAIETPMLAGAIPMCALDQHSAPGKRAIEMLAQAHPSRLAGNLGLTIFLTEGGLLNRWMAWPNDYRGLAESVIPYFAPNMAPRDYQELNRYRKSSVSRARWFQEESR